MQHPSRQDRVSDSVVSRNEKTTRKMVDVRLLPTIYATVSPMAKPDWTLLKYILTSWQNTITMISQRLRMTCVKVEENGDESEDEYAKVRGWCMK